MIISDRRKRKASWPLLLAGMLIATGVFALFTFWKQPKMRAGAVDPAVLFCDAENRQGDYFFSGGRRFGNGHTQTHLRAHSGSYSSRLLPGDNIQFGLGVKMTGLQAGGLYQATVWRYQHRNNSQSSLAARSEGGKNPLYLARSFSFVKEKSGWEQLSLRFFIPFDHPPDFAEVYVFSNGKDTVYFDDLEVRLLRTFEEKDFDIPVFDIWLDKDARKQLEEKRAEALEEGILVTSPDDLVKGKIRWNGLESPVSARFRLKGDWLDHLNSEKWSFRVSLMGGSFWQGMQTFSLQHPATRYYLHEWLLHEWWRREGVLTTTYDFAEVRLNGESLGIYAVEEHFEKYLIERQGRREGPILKLDETGFWDGIRHQLHTIGQADPNVQLPTTHPQHAIIEPFEARRTEANPQLAEMSRHAAALADQFRTGKKPVSELFDTDKLARFYAILDVAGAHHSTIWHNLRFYYNPLSDRLEPIGFDGFGTGLSTRASFLIQGAATPAGASLQDFLFRDTAFVNRYIGYLYRYSDPGYLDSFLLETTGLRLPKEVLLMQEYPEYTYNDQEFIQSIQRKRATLLPQQDFSFLIRKKREGAWELTNQHLFPLLVLGYAPSATGEWEPLPEPAWFPGAPDRPLWMETQADSAGVWTELEQLRTKSGQLLAAPLWPAPTEITLPPSAGWLVYQLPGVDILFRQEIRPGLSYPDRTPRQELLDRPFPKKDPRWEVSGRRIRFLAGRHTFSDWVVIPEGYSVEAGPGVTLDFVKGAGLLSLSPVHFSGNEEEPVMVTSSDRTAKGFTVLAPHAASSLEYTVFEHLEALEWKGWTQTGAVCFLEAPVRISRTVFRHMRSEDALNLVRCEVDMEHCLISNTPSDGFDCDFCTGEIRQSTFRKCGNDGLDFSGSRVMISSCTFESCGDKGISVGEQSDVAIFDPTIRLSNIGIAAKDRSVAVVDKLHLSHCKTGFALYQKKPEFGPSQLIVRDYQAQHTDRLYIVQWGSTLQLGEKLIRGTDQQILE